MTVGRNDPCPCGSGLKYKQCCLAKAAGQRAPAATQAATPAIVPLLQQAVAHFEARRLAAAEQCCRQVLQLAPAQSDALYILGMIALQAGRAEAAVELLRQATAAAPQRDAQRLLHLGMALQQLGRLEEAAGAFEQATRHRPALAESWERLGLVRQQQGRIAEAETAWREALRLAPQATVIACNLAAMLVVQKRLSEATTLLREALQRHPDDVQVLVNLAASLRAEGRLAEAESCCRRALACDPAQAVAHSNLGQILAASGRVEEAVTSFRQALSLRPDYYAAYANLLFTLQYLPGLGAAGAFAEHRRFAGHFEAPLKPAWPLHGNDRTVGRRLRIGYVSPDFSTHSVAYFVECIFASHDRGVVELFCYDNNFADDAMTQRLRSLSDHWIPCANLTDEALARRIREDGIDILVDLAGHTARNRLLTFARKPAPVQVTWIGYPGTTGLEAMDYRLTDAFLDPPGLAEAFHTETLVRLPAWATFKPEALSPPVNALPALTRGHLTLACLNNLVKVNTAVVALWARLLRELPTATLLLGNAGQPEVQARLEGMFAAAGIGPERLRLAPKLPLADYLALHHEIDIALDPFPFTGGVTTHHALWMGVPVITLAGETTISRQGSAILNSIGLGEFVARSADEYVEKVLALARDPERLDAIRQGLRERIANAPAPDAPQLTRALEQAYREMWKTWCGAE